MSSMSTGSSVWQWSAGKDQFNFHHLHQVMVSGSGSGSAADDQYQTWRAVASRLTLDNQFRNMTERHEYYSNADIDQEDEEEEDFNYNNNYCYYRKINFNNNLNVPLQLRSLEELKRVQQQQSNNSHDKWHKSLPQAEMLPRNEVLGGYIFVCNNETMQEDLHRQLFGLPQKYKDSVRAITPGLPLFLYNYTAHQLHGIFQAVSFGGSNIDPTAWEDKKCKGESRFPAQVRIRVKERCKSLEEDAFRPILYHYDGPKFRLQLSVPEALALLDLFKEKNF
ncbi:B2 protein isoform X2 [Prunus yedoensis var. nudiflora]|uniref:B2 protein isoform X2 n=1 Tax=Prunus yedoensis var. nudiflora TaxID=2094558 RepID=A0A314Z7R5_PRUYE|nr:B2 protein isoform X2 [Prunus yedoensis var. nudiflora]